MSYIHIYDVNDHLVMRLVHVCECSGFTKNAAVPGDFAYAFELHGRVEAVDFTAVPAKGMRIHWFDAAHGHGTVLTGADVLIAAFKAGSCKLVGTTQGVMSLTDWNESQKHLTEPVKITKPGQGR